MTLSIGIVGLPNVGKSTLFNALMQREMAKVEPHPFTTISPNKGIVAVPDARLSALREMLVKDPVFTQELTAGVEAVVEVVDIAGLIKGAAEGAGLGNQFLSHLRQVDLILHVLRQFANPQVPHVAGKINPRADEAIVSLELILSDLETTNRVLKSRKSSLNQKEIQLWQRIRAVLEKGQPALAAGLKEEEKEIIKDFNLLTLKPRMFILNISEEDLKNIDFSREKLPQGTVIPLCLRLLADLYQLEEKEREEYLKELGLKQTGLEAVIKAAYRHLGLITFYTVKRGKISAWSVKRGTTAVAAAELIHSDFAGRFIKAEVINWRELVAFGSWQRARQQGRLHLEGKDYKIKDGEVIEFKFN